MDRLLPNVEDAEADTADGLGVVDAAAGLGVAGMLELRESDGVADSAAVEDSERCAGGTEVESGESGRGRGKKAE